MNEIATAIEEVRAELSTAATEFLPDTCTIKAPGTETRDAYGEITTTDGDAATLVPCKYEALSAYEQSVGGSTVGSATHRLRLPANAVTLAIQPNRRIVVDTRGLVPALTFEVTGRLDASTDVMLTLAATLKG